jgi:outer membrane immunogenic protein
VRSAAAALLGLILIAGVARAQSDTPWAGGYAGMNAGGAWNGTCSTWTPEGAAIGPAAVSALDSRNCPGGAIVGGAQLGYNFQFDKLIVGVAADVDVWGAKNQSRSLKYSDEIPPAGTYDFSDNLGPKGFAVIGPRIGHAGTQWLPYLRAGAVIADGSRSTLTFIPAGQIKPAASFSGGKNFSTIGWAAGAGAEYGLNGPWSLTVEFLHENLGSGSGVAAACNGSAAACAAFSGLSFDSTHAAFSANILRIGINYWFGYWGP